MHVLIISDYDDYKVMNHLHFSITKGFELARGWSVLNKVYFLTTGKTEIFENVNLINVDEIDYVFLTSLDIILFIRETIVHVILDKWKLLKKYIDDNLPNKDGRRTKFGVKSDSYGWVGDKDFNQWTLKHYNMKGPKWAYAVFDVLYAQTLELLNGTKREFKESALEKLKISAMAVPGSVPDKAIYDNPFTLDHAYCVPYAENMTRSSALLPLPMIDNPILPKLRKILIYTGRLKIDGGKIMYMLRDIMQKLGDDYELHIFPGSFVIPDMDIPRLSAKNTQHLQLMRDHVFPDSTNIYIHFPYQHDDRFKYLYYADIGIDFSQSRPANVTSPQGNAKLLEYCSAGLPTVTERNVNNSHVLSDAKNGILLPGVATVDEYVDAIKKLAETNVDREYAKRVTLKNHNWTMRASEIIKDFS